uniref:Carboxylic ester hydrolase n=1 Tax=Amphiprion percula TaxID=161767 RepID=A0A3P8SGU0_AMPPE
VSGNWIEGAGSCCNILTAPEVHTKLGSLRGEYVSVKGKETGVHAYLGVPFAKPPIGPSLRLAPPQPVEGWKGVRDATKQPPIQCSWKSQFLMLLKKSFWYTDCDDITMGSASMYDGSAVAAYQDVVVVLIQYRLGLLGFLSTGDDHVSGNFGMLDQIEALRWVQEHIHNFGGDPDSVTIFGESAGGVIVSVLLLSPLSDGLFHRAIAESGTAAMDFLVRDDHLPAMESKNMVFWVNVDGHFLTDPVHLLFHKHQIFPVPYMTGVNKHEGGFAIPNVSVEVCSSFFDRCIVNFFKPKHAFKRDLITNEYIGTGEDRVKNRDGMTEMLGDILFTIPVNKAAIAHRDAGAAVYLYEFQHPPKILQNKRPSFVGCDHTDEIFLVLGFCFTTTHSKFVGKYACSEEEEQLSRTMMSYWGNFARTGSPNGDGLVHWPKYGAEEEYLAIGLKEQVVGRALKKDRFVFMTQTLPEKIQEHNENIEHSELINFFFFFFCKC